MPEMWLTCIRDRWLAGHPKGAGQAVQAGQVQASWQRSHGGRAALRCR